jgi:ribosomal protein L11 methyltransferase
MGGELVRLAVRVRASEAEIALARLLPVLAGGAEERSVGEAVEYALYGFPDELPDEASLRALAGDSLLGVSSTPVRGGWETAWHAHLGRVSAGGFWIRPPWVAGPAEDLVIEPGLTFGAAGHPTTRLCLELLLALAPPGGSLVDLGSGSGVLAITGALLGFSPVVALDVDQAAVDATVSNAAANGVSIEARRFDLRREQAPDADLVVANVLAPPLLAWAGLQAQLPPRLVLSGLLVGEVDRVASAYVARGMTLVETRADGEWAALLLRRGLA